MKSTVSSNLFTFAVLAAIVTVQLGKKVHKVFSKRNAPIRS